MDKAERTTLFGIPFTIALGAAIAWAGSQGGERVGDLPIFALCAALAYGINWLVFVHAYLAQTEHYFDLTGSLTYITLVVTSLALAPQLDPRSLLVAVLVMIWAGRLGTFLFRRIRQDGQDGRFDKLKPSFLRFFQTWTIQGLWVLLTLACGLVALTTAVTKPLGVFAALGTLIWIVGFAIEARADYEKRVFRKDPANEGKFITTGIWAWSRHPNYFGEITLWFGVAVIAFPVLEGAQYATLISPVFVYVLLTRVSGIPLLENRAKKKWGDDPEYQAYCERTPVLVPRPPSSN